MSRVLHKTCGEDGWKRSRYLIYAKLPEKDGYAVLDLYQGSFVVLTSVELYLLSIVEELDAGHPILEKFRKFGLIVNFDQTAIFNASGRFGCGHSSLITLTICPTLGCNFDCPYCFEDHRAGKMSLETQGQVVQLAQKMLRSFRAQQLRVTWYGGEPLLAPDVIESLSVRLMDLAEREGVKYSAGIVTNGYLLDAKNVRMLERCKVDRAQITLDGLKETHDRTRHLAGGGGTFGRICENIRDNRMSFRIDVRHNVHEDNLNAVEPTRAFVKQLAQESGNDLIYYYTLVRDSEKLKKRSKTLSTLQEKSEVMQLALELEAGRYRAKGGIFCDAGILSSVCIDDTGRLYCCWEDVDKPEKSFADVSAWNPDSPFTSADHPDMLASYVNTCCPDPVCQECLWLPMCCGGCPLRVMEGVQTCFPFKDDPGAFALAVYRALDEKEHRHSKPDEPS